MSSTKRITADTTLEEVRAMAASRRRSVERKVMRDIREQWALRASAAQTEAVTKTSLWRTVDGRSDRVCADCRDEIITANGQTLGDWMVIIELDAIDAIAGLAHCDACGAVVPMAVRA